MIHHSVSGYVSSVFCIICLLFVVRTEINAQCPGKQIFWDSVDAIRTNEGFSSIQKLEHYTILKSIADKCNLEHDSVYAKILLRIGVSEISANKNYTTGFNYIKSSLQINIAAKKGSSKFLTAWGYYTLGYNYHKLGLLDKALNYLDSSITSSGGFPGAVKLILDSKLLKTSIYLKNGDYQKAVEESIEGLNYPIQPNDSAYFFSLLIQRAQSLFYEGNITQALSDVNLVIDAAKRQNDFYDFASALKIKAFIFQKQQQYTEADFFFKKAIEARINTENYEQVANDYVDYGNFYLDSLDDYKNSKRCYLQTIFYAKKLKDSILLSSANTNIGEIYLKQKDYAQSSFYYNAALKYLNINATENILQNPTAEQLNAVSFKELGLVIMSNKARTLLELYAKTKNETDLSACLKTCLVTDTLITKMRYAQSGNESKLYWRNYTRSFYENAIKAGYLAGKPELGLFFMEKSRAVLLNDKLNELDASSYLSMADAAKQENYEIKIIELQQKLALLPDTSKQYQAIQLQAIGITKELDKYIHSLGTKYPAYYQYKYADAVPTLKGLQSYLAKNNQSFVHYFLGDTVTYILAVTSSNTKFIRLSQNEFNKEQLNGFLQFCANKEMLNNHYDSFASLSNSIYKKIFQQLQLPKGRIIICSDNIVIPFDALCTDAKGKNFLMNDYIFSYVYSARFLMKQFNNSAAKGNFLGFAPVSFNSSLGVADLKNAADALHASAAYYKNNKLFINQNATRSNFFYYASSYSIVNIFSHARADTTDSEPVLFMQDSLIHLSELQRLNNPATKFVLLSACQTNVGKTATGEGIYSLARGFAASGIPSVSATLWNADEQTIYSISEKFNQYLSEGMNKDEALQKAKLYFIQNNGSEKMLPYYWANMILIGNTDAVKLEASHNNSYLWFIAVGIAIIIIIIIIFRVKYFKK